MDMSTVDADTVTELAQVAVLFLFVLQHPFGWIPRPKLTMPKCVQLGYSRAKAREQRRSEANSLGTSLSSFSTFKVTVTLSDHEKRGAAWLR